MTGQRRMTLKELEYKYIEEILYESKGDLSRASTVLGITRSTLYRRMREAGIKSEDMRRLRFVERLRQRGVKFEGDISYIDPNDDTKVLDGVLPTGRPLYV